MAILVALVPACGDNTPSAGVASSNSHPAMGTGSGGVDAGVGATGGADAGGGAAGGADAGATGGSADGGAGNDGQCSDLFAQTLQTFSIDMSANDLAAMQAEFISAGQLSPTAFSQYTSVDYPVTFHYGSETVSDAYIHLKGQSSWQETVQYDGANGKMQVDIAFDHVNPSASFHGVSKLGFDMPRTDPTFLRERIANAWLREIGVPAICATSGQLVINGSLYGLYVVEESVGHAFIKKWFPANPSGDLFKGGTIPETNKTSPNWAREETFWAAKTPADLSAIVDVPNSFLDWAAECLLNDGDGYWGGDHNFYIYDEGAKGYMFLPTDLDASLDYLGQFTSDPIYWWSIRKNWLLPVPQHYLIMVGDAGLQAQFIQALSTQLPRLNVAEMQSWIDTWSAQISSTVTADPHKPTSFMPGDFEAAVALARSGVQQRADYVSSWLQCKSTQQGPDKDGDGFIWCNDCNDNSASIYPGAPEICGNQIDDNCNGMVDEGCPTTTTGP